MKYFFTVIWGIICIGVLAYGHFHWNQQTAVKAGQPVITQESTEIDVDRYLEYAANWPESAKEQLKLSLESELPFKILFVGSSAMEWEESLSQSLSESFSSERLTTAVHTYDGTTTQFIEENKQLELAAEKAQLIVIEPFLLNDNNKVKMDVTLANLTKMMDEIKAENPDTSFILQPAYPIYLPKLYSSQVEALKQFAEANNIAYLDHWTARPVTDDIEIKDYLTEGQSGPNEKGYQVWAQYLVDYFVNKEAN